jgi:hypothetical protein
MVPVGAAPSESVAGTDEEAIGLPTVAPEGAFSDSVGPVGAASMSSPWKPSELSS